MSGVDIFGNALEKMLKKNEDGQNEFDILIDILSGVSDHGRVVFDEEKRDSFQQIMYIDKLKNYLENVPRLEDVSVYHVIRDYPAPLLLEDFLCFMVQEKEKKPHTK